MPNLVRISVDGVDDLLNVGMYDAGAVVRLHTAATKTGVYSSVGTAALVSGTAAYTIYHTTGTSTSWYRTRYENAGGTVTSDWSPSFQVGSETAGYLCSLYDVKQRLGIPDATTTDDETLLEIIRQVSSYIERLVGRDFTGDQSDTVYVMDVPQTSRMLEVPRGVQSITTLGIATSSQPQTGGTYTTATATDYFIRPANREWLGEPGHRVVFSNLSGTYFVGGYNTVQLTGKLGWAVVPPEVERIAASAVVAQHLTKGSEGPRAVIGPDGRAVILRDISPADYATLLGFQDPTVA